LKKKMGDQEPTFRAFIDHQKIRSSV
jgi:hypothetical protein